MAIDFPSSPTVGQQYTFAGITYTFTPQGVWSASSGSTGRGAISTHYSDIGLSEGYHYATMLGACNGSTAVWPSPVIASGIGSRLTGFVGMQG